MKYKEKYNMIIEALTGGKEIRELTEQRKNQLAFLSRLDSRNTGLQFVLCGGRGDRAWNVPKDFVYAEGINIDGIEKGFLIPKEEYNGMGIINDRQINLEKYRERQPNKLLPYSKT